MSNTAPSLSPGIGAAEALLAEVETTTDTDDLRDAQSTANRAIRLSDDPTVVMWYRLVAALAQRQLGDIVEARSTLVDLLSDAALIDPAVGGRAGMHLSGLLIMAGEFEAAEKAIIEAEPLIDVSLRPRLLVQQAFLLQMRERADLAHLVFTEALEAASTVGDDAAVAYVLNNRGILFAQQHNHCAAEVDLRRAMLVAPAGSAATASIEHNLGQLLGRRGEIRESLARIHNAATVLDTDPAHNVGRFIAESEILLGARLLDEAAAAARSAIAAAERHGTTPQHPEALVLLGRVALARRDLARARTLFADAADHFGLQDRPASYMSTRRVLQVLDASDLNDIVIDVTSPEIVEALLAVGANDRDRTDALIAATEATSSVVGTTRLLGHAAAALAAQRGGDAAAARTALSAAATELAEVAGAISSLELRASAAHRFPPLEGIGVELALQTHNPQDFLDAILGPRAVVLNGPPPGANARLVAELEALSDRYPDAATGTTDGHELDAIEERITTLARLQPATHTHPFPAPTAVSTLINNRGHLTLGFAATPKGVARVTIGTDSVVTDLGPIEPIEQAMRQLGFAASQMARSHHLDDPRRLQSALDADASTLQGLLLSGLQHRPSEVTIIPGRMLTGVPWRLLPAFSTIPLRVSIAGMPSLPATTVTKPRAVTVIVGPGLAATTTREITAICDHYPRSTVMAGADATVGAALRALASDNVVHIAAHGIIHTDDPLFSSVELANGPLTSHHIETIAQVCGTIVLAACGLGTGPVGQPIDYELATILATRGAQEIVLANVDLADPQSAVVMPALHAGLAAGKPARVALTGLSFNDPITATAALSLLPAEPN